jgi:hypothetical protein
MGGHGRPLRLGAAILLLGAALAWPQSAGATTYTVTTLDTDTDSTDGVCSIREAIISANNDLGFSDCVAGSGPDVINITATGTMNLTNVTGTLPNIQSDITINGPGASLLDIHRTIDAPPTRVMTVNNTGVLDISGVTISGGKTTDISQSGAGIANFGGTVTLEDAVVTGNRIEISEDSISPAPSGGGIANSGTLTIRRSTVSNNTILVNQTATSGQWIASAAGGGIDSSSGTLTVVRSTINNNVVSVGAATDDVNSSAIAEGGGIRVNAGTANIRLSTVSTNQVFASITDGTEAAKGGGISNHGTLTLTADTIGLNTGADSASLSAQGNETVRSTILTPNNGDNCDDGIVDTDDGFNLDFPASCQGLEDAIHQDPHLNTLADNGGPTKTHSLFHTLANPSAAVDAGCCGTDSDGGTDQRGLTRPVDVSSVANAVGGDGSDIGSFEATDSDGDGVLDEADDCPNGVANGTDTDGDGCKDVDEDLDDDDDGVADTSDNCPTSLASGTDTDADGCVNTEDNDDDNDGVTDNGDGCPLIVGGGDPTGCPADGRSLTLSYRARKEKFKGKLIADSAPGCTHQWDVFIFRKVPGPDEDKQIGVALSDFNGRYKLFKHARAGKYYSRVNLNVLGGVAACQPAQSPTITVG